MFKARDPERAAANLRGLQARHAPLIRARAAARAGLIGLLACGQGHKPLGVHPGQLASNDAGGVPAVDGSSATLTLANPPRRLRRLSNREYNNVVRDLLGDA